MQSMHFLCCGPRMLLIGLIFSQRVVPSANIPFEIFEEIQTCCHLVSLQLLFPSSQWQFRKLPETKAVPEGRQ